MKVNLPEIAFGEITLENILSKSEAKSNAGFSMLHNVDTTSVPDVKTTLKQRCTTPIQRCIIVVST